jgi:hypothetical protein
VGVFDPNTKPWGKKGGKRGNLLEDEDTSVYRGILLKILAAPIKRNG